MTKWLQVSATICIALKHDTCIFTHRRFHDNHSFKTRDTCLLVVRKVDHSSGIPRKDFNRVNDTICFDCYTDRHSCNGWRLEGESRIIDPDTRTATMGNERLCERFTITRWKE